MVSRYITLIVRVQLDASKSQLSTDRAVRGSLQRAGAEEIHYFTSFDELPELLKQAAETTERLAAPTGRPGLSEHGSTGPTPN